MTQTRILQARGGAGTPLRHVDQALGIAESLLGKRKHQYEQKGDNASQVMGVSTLGMGLH